MRMKRSAAFWVPATAILNWGHGSLEAGLRAVTAANNSAQTSCLHGI
jgi:hypothetical protein